MMNKFSIYVHVPWCRRRCPYCNFYLVVGRPAENFVDSLISEWSNRRHRYQNGLAASLYLGGGTPSLLTPPELTRLTDYFFAEQIVAHDAEITLEANPEDLSPEYVQGLSKTAVNRVSLGIQSFDDRVLKHLGRKHSAAMAQEAISRLMEAGFTNISVDLILGVPGEDHAAIFNSINYLQSAGIKHISAYLLTIEEGTKFHRRIADGKMVTPPEDAQVEIYTKVQHELTRLGYCQYDISSYGQPEYFSQHNQVYWAGLNYIGLGPGAHSMMQLPNGGIERTQNQADLKAWLKSPIENEHWITETLTPDEALREALAFGLRNMALGINPEQLAKRHQVLLPKEFLSVVKKYRDLGWLTNDRGAMRITQEGALFADAIMRDILCT